MNCKHCQAELEEGVTLCPACGKEQDAPLEEATTQETVTAETPAEEVPPTEVPEEETPAEEVPATEVPAEEVPPTEVVTPEREPLPFETKPYETSSEVTEGIKATPGKIAIAIAAGVVLLAVLVALIIKGLDSDFLKKLTASDETIAPTSGMVEETVPEETVVETIPANGNPDDVTCKGSYTVTDEEILASADEVVATMDGADLTVAELQVYYWMEVRSFLQQYGDYAAYFGLDYNRALDVQTCDLEETPMTWQQYFLDYALDTWMSYQSMALEAEANGFTLTDEQQAYIDGLPAELEATAKENGLEDALALVKLNVGASGTLENYLEYVRLYNTGYTFFASEHDKIQPTDEDVEAYFAENESYYAENNITKESGKYVDVRHILLQPEGGETGENGYPVFTDEAWEACRLEAEKLYAEWQEGDKSEDSFAQYAKDNSVDGSASNGGLYTDVVEGQMVPAFNDWCFDAARQVGDHGLVKTEYGYHIMFFSGSRDIYFVTAKQDYINERAAALVPAAIEKHPYEIDFSAIKLGLVDLT